MTTVFPMHQTRATRRASRSLIRFLSPLYLVRLNAAWRDYQKFRALDDFRLYDLGIRREDVEKVDFAEFWAARQH